MAKNRNFVAKHSQNKTGAGVHQDKKGEKAPRVRQKREWKKNMLRDMNESVRQRDPFDQAIKEIEKEYGINLAEGMCGAENEEDFDPHALDNDQLRSIVDYAHEELLQGQPADDHQVMDALQSALDDVPGFEVGDRAEITQRLLAIYHQIYR